MEMILRAFIVFALVAGVGLALICADASAQTPDKAATDLNNAWSALVNSAQNAAINGPDQLRAASEAQKAMVAWMKEQQAKTAADQAQIANLSRELAAANAKVAMLSKAAQEAAGREKAGDSHRVPTNPVRPSGGALRGPQSHPAAKP